MRRAQRRFVRLVDDYRLFAFLARRQFGKTTTFARVALKKMMKQRDHSVIFGSAKLNLSREIVRKEAEILQAAIREAAALSTAADADRLQVVDSTTQRRPDHLTNDDFADLFEAQRLEFRFFHTRTSYSRTKVVALRPDTVGETGDLMCDEIGRINNWREVWEAVSPIISSNPGFRLLLSTTVPPDDSHYSFEQLAPPVDAVFTPNPDGNLYVSEMGITVFRVDAWDAYLDNVPLYDQTTGEPLTPEESRKREHDRDAWDRNYGLVFVVGGSSACGLLQLQTAQQRGVGACAYINVETDSDMEAAGRVLATRLGPGIVTVGADLATTTKGTSNPTAVAFDERASLDHIFRLIVTWKTADPKVARLRIRRLVEAVAARTSGGRAKSLAVDATNERYFAADLRDHLRDLLPVRLVVGSETIQLPGQESPINLKQHTGSVFVGELDDNHLWLPPERYIRDDFRLVRKERGILVCTPDVDGKHGDTFDACKLAVYAGTVSGPAEASAAPVGSMSGPASKAPRKFPPRPDHNSDHRITGRGPAML
jgi:hypothetical protein